MLEAALAYAARGWEVLPAPPGEKLSYISQENDPDNKPWGKTTDPDKIKSYFRRFRRANIGIATGADSGIVVLETDTPEGHDVDGEASLAELEAQCGPLPETLMFISPSGSKHRYFKHPRDRKVKTSASKPPGIDVRGDGGMVIAPPSIKPGKGAYRQLNDCEIAELPPLWLDLMEQKQSPTRQYNDVIYHGEFISVHEYLKGKGGISKSKDPRDFYDYATILSKIDPDSPRQVWWELGCVCFRLFGPDRGYTVWDTWSIGGEKYNVDPGNRIDIQWDSIVKGNYNYGVGTLLHYADPERGYLRKIGNSPANIDESKHDAPPPNEPRPHSNRLYELVRASDIKPRQKNWLWIGHLLRGSLELTTGMTGIGKSQIHCSIIASATSGKPWPDGEENRAGPIDVVMVTAEDILDQS
jgi:hypothetical protein